VSASAVVANSTTPLADALASLAATVIVVPLFVTPIGLVPLNVKSALPLVTSALPLLVEILTLSISPVLVV